MIGLVQRRKGVIKKHKKEKLPKLRLFMKFNPKIMKILLMAVSFVSLIFTIIYIFQKTLFSPNNTIQIVKYSQSSIDVFDEPYLYKKISTLIKGKNYYKIKYLDQKNILDQVFQEFAIINDFEISYSKNNVVDVKISFNKPDLIIKNQNLNFGIYGGYTFQVYSGNTIGSGVQKIYFPEYLSGLDNIDGIFYDTTSTDFVNSMYSIIKSFPNNKRIIYLPGGQRTIVELEENKRVYINNAKDLDIQFKNYLLLKKYYSNFANLKQIDLGSLEMDKVIVSG